MQKIKDILQIFFVVFIIYLLNSGYKTIFPDPKYSSVEDAVKEINELEEHLMDLEYQINNLEEEKNNLEEEKNNLELQVQKVIKEVEYLNSSINTLISEVEDFSYEDWRDNVPEVVEATIHVDKDFQKLKKELEINDDYKISIFR